MTECDTVLDLINYVLKNLKSWMKSEDRELPALLLPGSARVEHEPLGVVLIIGSWNFPFAVTLGPLIYAIAGGNAAIIKPSESSEASSKLMENLIARLDQTCYRAIQGGPEVSKHLCSLKWDLITFTGSTEKGKLIAAAAAVHLTPTVLELGGKNPVVVDKDANLRNAGLRIHQGRTLNVGQMCISPEYVLVHSSIHDKFVNMLVSLNKEFYGEDPEKSQDLGRLINTFHSDRINRLMNSHGGEVVCGGKVDVATKYCAPTIIKNPRLDSPLMQEEIFGPILSIFTYDNIDECIKFINDRDKPLAIYYFGGNKGNMNKLLARTSSGGFVQNETAFHYAVPDLPFGGVGASGMGRYHGPEGFACMTNTKAVFLKDTYNGYPVSLRYPPFNRSGENTFMRLKAMTAFSSKQLYSGMKCVGAIGILVAVMYYSKISLSDVKNAIKKALRL